MHCNCASGYYICHLFMATTSHDIWFQHVIILAYLFRGSHSDSINTVSAGAKRIPLSLTGFIQYVGPTIMFILGIFVFKEKFDINQLITFIFI